MPIYSLGAMKACKPGYSFLGIMKIAVPSSTLGAIKNYVYTGIEEIDPMKLDKTAQTNAWNKFAASGNSRLFNPATRARVTEDQGGVYLGSATQTRPLVNMTRSKNRVGQVNKFVPFIPDYPGAEGPYPVNDQSYDNMNEQFQVKKKVKRNYEL